MSNLPRRLEEFPVILTGALAPTTVIIPTSTDIRLIDSTTANLLAGASYTSSGLNIRNYSYITGTVFADQPGTLKIEYSSNSGVNYDGAESTAYVAGQQKRFSFFTVAPLARMVFTNNGALAQTTFRLYVFGKLSS